MPVSTTHVVLIPSYNTGPQLRAVVAEALEYWQPVIVVIDGSTDGSERAVLELARHEPGLEVIVLPRNSGKGSAVLAGARAAVERGYTHALTMDADRQHPAAQIEQFMEISRLQPDALVLGRPIFPANVPWERLHGRRISVLLVRWAILGAGIDDPLYGFRVYPLGPLLAVLESRRTARRYDFDAEAAVRLCWAGIRPVNVPAAVRYLTREEGGISHFHYGRDNLTLVRMHGQLLFEMLGRVPELLRHRRRWRAAGPVVSARAESELLANATR
jgi:glycosyltransferase involved in cell wall biosynthesis